MKDNRLEEEFDEYFKGVNIPDDITADAKKCVTPRRKVMPKFVKFASIAASFVLVFAVALTVIFKNDFKKGSSNGGDASVDNTRPDAPDSSAPGTPDSDDQFSGGSEGNSSGGAVRFKLYTDSDLINRDENVYSLSSLDSSLKLIENFALAKTQV